MAEQVSLYVDDMKEEEIVEPKDETYIEEKYKKIVEKLPEIDEMCIRDSIRADQMVEVRL